jgi:hypothetical protein
MGDKRCILNQKNECKWHILSMEKSIIHILWYLEFFAPCIVVQLCNVNQQNAHSLKLMFQFNAWRLLYDSNIMCSSSGRTFVHAVFYVMFFRCLCMRSRRWKDVLHIEHVHPPAVSKRYASNIIGLGQGWWKSWGGDPKLRTIFGEIISRVGNLTSIRRYSRLFQWRLSDPYRLEHGQLPRWPAPWSGSCRLFLDSTPAVLQPLESDT